MRGFAARKCTEVIFLLIQAVFYILFLFLDITDGSIRLSTGIKYCIIILCFCYALLSESGFKSIVFIYSKGITKKEDTTKTVTLLLQAGLFFTLISDLFILVLDYYFYGVLIFILVQQIYSIRLIRKHVSLRLKLRKPDQSKRGRVTLFFYLKRLLIQMVSAGIVILTLQLCKVTPDRLLVTSIFYFICILTNTFSALHIAFRERNDKSNLLYGIGMLFFLLCDINVGLFNLSGFITLPNEVYTIIYSYSSILMWTFYAPSQILIALSSHSYKLKASCL